MKNLPRVLAALTSSVAFASVASAQDCTVALTMPTLNAPYFAAMDAAVIDEADRRLCGTRRGCPDC
jgi:ribose transport system substrate-binding protein